MMKSYETGRFLKHIKRDWQLYVMFAFPFVWFVIFSYLPMLGLTMAFTEYDLGSGIGGFFTGTWAGLKYFKEFVGGYDFWRILRNTVCISLLDIAVNFPLPIVLAVMFDQLRNKYFKKATQTIAYLPKFISMVIIVSIYQSFLSLSGVFNNIREFFGADRKIFLADPGSFWILFTFMNTWASLGWSSIIYCSAMSGISPELYEAAKIDGAGRWGQIRHITLPGIAGTITIMFILRVGQIINVGLEPILLLVPPRETVIYETAEVLALHVYRRGVQKLDYSYATAVGLFQSVIGLIFVVATNKITKKTSGNSLW